MAVKSLELHEKSDVVKKAVQDTDGIAGIDCSNKIITGILNSLQVTRGNIPTDTDYREILGHELLPQIMFWPTFVTRNNNKKNSKNRFIF